MQDLKQSDEFMQLWKNEAERLKDLLALKPHQPKIPLAVLCCTSDACLTEDVVRGLELQRLILNDMISDFRVFSLDPDVENPQTSREVGRKKIIVKIFIESLTWFHFFV